MSKRTGPTNPILKKLIENLKEQSLKNKSLFLRDIAEKLNKPRRQRVEVNIAHIERHSQEGETVIVPGVILGYGDLSKPITVSGWKFSKSAIDKIKQAKGTVLTIEELVKNNPKGTNVKIMC